VQILFDKSRAIRSGIFIVVFSLFCAGTWATAKLYAQEGLWTSHSDYLQVVPRISYVHWSIKQGGAVTKIQQVISTIDVRVPLSSTSDIRLFTSGGETKVRAPFQEEIKGITDTKVIWSKFLNHHGLLIQAGMNIPSGRSDFSTREHRIGNILSLDEIGLPVKIYGEGFDMLVDAAYSFSFGRRVALGVGAGYSFRNEYKLFSEKDIPYEPGDELTVSTGVDVRFRNALLKASTQFIYYKSDKHDGRKVFRNGQQVNVDILFVLQGVKWNSYIAVRDIFRGKARRRVGWPMIEELMSSNGNLFLGYAGLSYRLLPSIKAGPTFEIRRLEANDYPDGHSLHTGASTILGAGIRIDYYHNDHFILFTDGKFLKGKMDDGRFNLRAYQMSFGFQFLY